MPRHLAVVGAGIAGLAAARVLHRAGHTVSVFDKGRRWGGRLAQRHSPFGRFEHGAPWQADKPDWLTPDLTATSAGLGPLHMQTRVLALSQAADGWLLQFENQPESQRFDAVVVTVPAPQLAALLPAGMTPESLACIRYAPCWALMWVPAEATHKTPMDISLLASPLASIRREAPHPGPMGLPRWTVQARAEWSRARLQAAPATVQAELVQAAAEQLGCSTASQHAAVHRWLHARVEQPLGRPQLRLAPRLHYASDGCLGDGLFAAAASGEAAAHALLRSPTMG